MPSITYNFYEVALGDLLVSGSVDVDFSIQPAEPDVGILRAYAEDIHITNRTIELECVGEDGEPFTKTLHCANDAQEFFQLEEALAEALQTAANEWEPYYGD